MIYLLAKFCTTKRWGHHQRAQVYLVSFWHRQALAYAHKRSPAKGGRHEVENWKIWGINDTAMMKHSCCKKWDTMAFLTFLESYHVKSWRFPWISFTMSGSLVTSMQAPKWKWPTLPFERVGNLNLVEVGGSCWWVKCLEIKDVSCPRWTDLGGGFTYFQMGWFNHQLAVIVYRVKLWMQQCNCFPQRSTGCLLGEVMDVKLPPEGGCFWGVFLSVRKFLAFLGIWRLAKYYWCRGKKLSSYVMLLVQVFVSLGFLKFWLPPFGVWELFSMWFYDPVKVVLVEPVKISSLNI